MNVFNVLHQENLNLESLCGYERLSVGFLKSFQRAVVVPVRLQETLCRPETKMKPEESKIIQIIRQKRSPNGLTNHSEFILDACERLRTRSASETVPPVACGVDSRAYDKREPLVM